MKVSRRLLLQVSAGAGAGATLASSVLARPRASAPPARRDIQFDRGWTFLLGDPADVHLPAFDDSGFRDLDLPHDWSFEDRPGAVKEAAAWAPPVARWSPTERTKPRTEIIAGGPVELAQVPPATPDGPPRPIGPFDPANTSMGWGVGWTVGGVGWYRKRFPATDLLPDQQVELRREQNSETNSNFSKTAMAAAIMSLMTATMASAQPVWRDTFQSSPSTYEAPTEELLQAAARQLKIPVEAVKRGFMPSPVEGTIRYRITVTGAGNQVRIRFSNEEGRSPLMLASASIGLAGDKFVARPSSLRRLTFGGAAGITIPAGAPAVSDPIDLPVTSGMELIVSAALASPFMNEAMGGAGFEIAPGDQAMHAALSSVRSASGRPLLSGVEVRSEKSTRVIVTLGDSITDGNRAVPGALHGWPEQLARRLATTKRSGAFTVVNAGIAGNRVLAPGWGAAALARLDRDALRIDGISHLILLEGINDIGMSGVGAFGNNPEISPAQLIAAYRQIIARAHARGVKVIIGTLTPIAGSTTHSSPPKDAIRAVVNAWIRTAGEADGVIDFDAMVRDPASPGRFLAAYDSGDHLHPSDAGYRAMGNGIDLKLFDLGH